MAWYRQGDKPLSEPMVVRFLTHICVARPQSVNTRCENTASICCLNQGGLRYEMTIPRPVLYGVDLVLLSKHCLVANKFYTAGRHRSRSLRRVVCWDECQSDTGISKISSAILNGFIGGQQELYEKKKGREIITLQIRLILTNKGLSNAAKIYTQPRHRL